MSVTTRPYIGEADLPAVIDLLLACRAAESIDEWPPLIELRLMLTVSSLEQRDTCLWEQADGALVAFALLLDGAYLVSLVDPQAEQRDLQQRVLRWAQARVRVVGQARGEPGSLSVAVRENEAVRIGLLEQHGFALQDWQTLRMAYLLDGPLPEPSPPAGFTIRPLAGEHEAEAYLALYHQAFPDSQMTVEQRLALMRDSAYIPALDLVMAGPDGAFAAFCTCAIGWEENERLGRCDSWVDLIGTRPDLRGQGLGRAILLAGLRQLQAHEVNRALLGTQSTNSARHLYESVGFRVAHQVLWYRKAL